MSYKHLCFVLAGCLVLVIVVAGVQIGRLKVHPWNVRSELVVPTTKLLSDINSLAEAGERDLAMEKLKLWEKHWNKYLGGGETPEGFCQSILDYGSQPQSSE